VVVPELAGVPVVAPYDFIHDDEHANDDNGHGTHLAGLIASQDRLRGHAPTPVLMPIKVLDEDRVGTEWALVQGLYWAAEHGAEVVNLSLVFGPGYLPGADLVAAVDAVLAGGGVVVAAAGNGDLDQVGYPAALPGVTAVGAARLKDADQLKYVEYSNRGFAIDLAGPGGDVTRDENDDGIPDGMIAQTIDPADPAQVDYWVMAGTSQATAVVAGQAAWALAEGVPAPEVQKVLSFGRSAGLSGYSDGSDGDRQELGDGAPSASRFDDYFAPSARAALPELFAHTALAVTGDGSKRRAKAYVQVIDASGAPVRDVVVRGTFRGDAVSQEHDKTDEHGIAELESDEVDYHQVDPAAFFMLTIDGLQIEVGDQKVAVDPGGYYPLSEGNAHLIAAAVDAHPGEGLLFHIDPAGPTCAPFDCGHIDDSWMARSLGGGFAGSVVSMTFNTKWFQTVGGAGFAGSVVSVGFSSPKLFSWGTSDTASYEVWPIDGSGFAGSVVSSIPWEGSFWSWGSGFAGSVVSMLAYDVGVWGTGYGSADVLVPGPGDSLWGSGFAGSVVSMSSTYSSWAWGSGFAGSVVSMGQWSSLMFGNGFAGSVVSAPAWYTPVWGSGFAGSVVSSWSWVPSNTYASSSSGVAVVALGLGVGEVVIDP
jgi:hypothetical protein